MVYFIKNSKFQVIRMLLLEKKEIIRRFPENYTPGELDFCKEEFSYFTNAVYAGSFENVVVNGGGFAFDSRFRIIKESLIHIHQFHQIKSMKRLILKSKRKLPDENYLLCFDEWSSNHYHWFCDFLPRLYCAKQFLESHVLLLPYNNYVCTVGIEILTRLQLLPHRIEWIRPEEMVKAKRITIVNHPAMPGKIHDLLIKTLHADIQKTFGQTEFLGKKIYISRSKARYRNILNEKEVSGLFKEYGFEIICFEDYSITEQISISSNSAAMASIHGAGLTNALFMKGGSKILEFRRDTIYHNQCYWHLADALNHKYYYLFGHPDSDKVIEGGNGCNLTIPLPHLKNIIEKINAVV